ncbi:MAG TPA: TerC family protein [Usitatibacter sp.]|jgi:predicted tellurium resistance membrane protein TerC|nr:TerC family protein [Usitatibacter sp.]
MEFFTFDWVSDPAIWLSLATLAGLEIVLGIDNLVFIAILTERLPQARRALGRKVGLALALLTRLMLLGALAWIVTLTRPVLRAGGVDLSWRDLMLLAGGLFLLVKATREIHHSVEGDAAPEHGVAGAAVVRVSFAAIVAQIAVVDIIFSLDSVITAVGMADRLWVMVLAVVIAMVLMIVASTPLAEFVAAHPTVKMLALSFLLMIGVVLVADGLHFHIPKGYVYSSLAFSIIVEALNFRARRRRAASRRPVP